MEKNEENLEHRIVRYLAENRASLSDVESAKLFEVSLSKTQEAFLQIIADGNAINYNSTSGLCICWKIPTIIAFKNGFYE